LLQRKRKKNFDFCACTCAFAFAHVKVVFTVKLELFSLVFASLVKTRLN